VRHARPRKAVLREDLLGGVADESAVHLGARVPVRILSAASLPHGLGYGFSFEKVNFRRGAC
jgi:hypothetical protein